MASGLSCAGCLLQQASWEESLAWCSQPSCRGPSSYRPCHPLLAIGGLPSDHQLQVQHSVDLSLVTQEGEADSSHFLSSFGKQFSCRATVFPLAQRKDLELGKIKAQAPGVFLFVVTVLFPGLVIPELRTQRQGNHLRFEAGLVYTVSSRSALSQTICNKT